MPGGNRLTAGGEEAPAVAPHGGQEVRTARERLRRLVISASRRTDIPSFYAPWLCKRLDEGFVQTRNPFSGRLSTVSLDAARFFVFWTKEPSPAFDQVLLRLERRGLGYYIQYTLNDYHREGLEPGLAPAEKRVRTFQRLSRRLGRERVIWRFDPLILTPSIDVPLLLRKLKRLGDELSPYTEKLVISFADISGYARVKRNLRRCRVSAREWSTREQHELATGLSRLNATWGLELATCAEPVDLERPWGIVHNRCVDDRLIARLAPTDAPLQALLSAGRNLKDPGQRTHCGCMVSTDIGAYDTCPHLCCYCYANSTPSVVRGNHAACDPASPLLVSGQQRNCKPLRVGSSLSERLAHDARPPEDPFA